MTAQTDPLRSEGQLLAERLGAVEARAFEGMTHEFFGMGAVVDEAKTAMEFAVRNLRDGFATSAANAE